MVIKVDEVFGTIIDILHIYGIIKEELWDIIIFVEVDGLPVCSYAGELSAC